MEKEKAADGAAPKTKKGPKIVIRHTATSKLRMERANPLLTLKNGESLIRSAAPVTPSIRRSTFQPGMLRTVNNPPPPSKGAVSETRQTRKATQGKQTGPVNHLFTKPGKPLSQNNRCTTSKLRANSGATGSENAIPSGPTRQRTRPQVLQTKSAQERKLNSAASSTSCRRETFSVVSAAPEKRLQPMKKTTAPAPMQKTQPKSLIRSRSVSDVRKPHQSAAAVAQKGTPNGKAKFVAPRSRPPTPGVALGAKRRQQQPLKSILRRSVSASEISQGNSTRGEEVLRETQPETPKLPNRSKSVAFFSPFQKSILSVSNSAVTPPPSVLRERLTKWLEKRGKSTYNFHHLKCFGLHSSHSLTIPQLPRKRTSSKPLTEDPPCLNETVTLETSDLSGGLSDNEINGSSTPEQKENAAPTEDCTGKAFACPEALQDLRKLIFSGYPRDQCENWLTVICRSVPAVKELPEYWECRAALEEARGYYSAAVECYQKAIVRGADTVKVEESLDSLWEQFCKLDMEAKASDRTPPRSKIDPKCIFKSSIIKFALQEKAVKKFSSDTGVELPSFVVTPVRRSTRRSSSHYRSTPTTVKCVDTLGDLDEDTRSKMTFNSNPNI